MNDMDFKDKIIENLMQTIESLNNEIALLRAEAKQRDEEHSEQLKALNQQVANLTETIRNIAGKRFGTSSEKSKGLQIEGQMALDFLNEVEQLSDESTPEPSIEELCTPKPRAKAARKPRGTREALFTDIPIVEELYVAQNEDSACEHCASSLAPIGKEFVREELRITPAKVERIHLYRESYICNECKDDGDTIEVTKAMVPTPLFKHSLASPSIVSHIMYQKYVNALPLNRQEKDFARLGVTLNRSVQANWVNNSAASYFRPIYDELHKELLGRDLAMSDETPCQVHNEEGRKATTDSYMWVHRTGEDGLPPIILYDYQPTRNGDHAVRFLAGFTGFHHCDGYGGYNKLKDVIRIACLAHIRRKFVEALPKERTGNKLTPAEEGVILCDKLFELEREFKDDEPDVRKQKRLEQSKPVLEAFWRWLDKQDPPGGSNLYKAVNYARNQKEYMNNFLLNGRISISNALTENSVRPYTLIRKNSLFHDTPKGATASAIICSLMETAKASGLDVEKYLEHLLLKMPDRIKESAGIKDLMPWSKEIQQLCKSKQKLKG